MVHSNDLSNAAWHTSSYSGGGQQCVEVAGNLPGAVAIRDSKNLNSGMHIISLNTFKAFVAAVTDEGHPGRVR